MGNKNSKQFILHVIDSLEVGGAEKLLVNTIDVLDEYNHLICFLAGDNKFPALNEFHKVICLQHKSNFNFFKTVTNLKKIIDQYNPVLVHAHLLKSTWISRAATSGKCPLIFTIHNKLSEDAFKVNKLSYYFEKLTYSKHQAVIGVSNEVLKDYNHWIRIKGKAEVLYNMIEDKFFKKSLKNSLEKGVLKLIAVGNLRRQKNYLNLLNAFLLLRDYNIQLDIYGSGDEYESLQGLINKNSLPIRLMGKVNNIDEVMCNYDAFIQPSSFEGYGIAAVEAMAVGLPVILSDIDVFREVTKDEAIYFKPSDPEDISKAILLFYNMPIEKVILLQEKMSKRAMEIGTSELFKKNILKIYGSIINDKN
jgi:glycosyltransferase involved in cell wall biosynthesis